MRKETVVIEGVSLPCGALSVDAGIPKWEAVTSLLKYLWQLLVLLKCLVSMLLLPQTGLSLLII